MQVTEFSAAEQAKLREKLKPVIDKHGAAISRHRGRTAGRTGQAAQVNARRTRGATMAATATKLLCGLIGAGIQRSLTPAMQEAEAARPGPAPALPADRPGPRGQGVDALPGCWTPPAPWALPG
jgi:hypothetical protein